MTRARQRQSAAEQRRAAMQAGQPRLRAVALIYLREMRDQLRDRRTLFTIAVLPILLYPLVGMLLLQIAQFTRQHPTSVCVVGSEHLQDAPPLLRSDMRFAAGLADEQEHLELIVHRWDDLAGNPDFQEQPSRWVREGTFDAVLLIPPEFADSRKRAEDRSAAIELLYNVASDQSLVARERVSSVLSRWRNDWVRQRLNQSGVDLAMLEPFQLSDIDIAPERTREAAFWSKLLPFIMLVWAMTGAFYPAIDLVAGEKERGTLETLLCSPALRSEIVWGKLGAVTTFSMLTAVLNASSMLVTSSFVFGQMGIAAGGIGAPPIVPMLWLFVALIPLSALFSALALSVAAMARSSKEGQYYLMPLMMVTLPLVLLPMLPGTTLTAGTSLIPVTGMFLLVRALVEGQYWLALWHLPMVIGMTAGCLWLAVSWARRQFEEESVLFGGGDQWELSMWVRHLWRDRQLAATPTQAFACGATILVGLFFGKLAVTSVPEGFAGVARMVLLPQIGLILAPALLMATVLTTSLRTSLRIRMPHWTTLPLAVLLGVTLHPMYVMLAQWISYTYPVSEQAAAAMKPFADQISAAPWLSVLFLMALVPAICEELAFRGFIFGGLVREKGRLRAVVVTALMFGISHGVLQQSIAATIMGVLLGWVALRTGSVLPGILIHFTNNALSVSMERIASSRWEGASLFLTTSESGPAYQPMWIVVSIGVAVTCLLYFASVRPRVEEDDADYLQLDRNLIDPTASLATSTA
ncbi:MAG: ABC transporter permease subunit [Pirellulales bacterium]|nr:ABC transporter permease subunit [Pirellulales bacterium]